MVELHLFGSWRLPIRLANAPPGLVDVRRGRIADSLSRRGSEVPASRSARHALPKTVWLPADRPADCELGSFDLTDGGALAIRRPQLVTTSARDALSGAE